MNYEIWVHKLCDYSHNTRVSTKGQLDGNSIEEQTNAIQAIYADAEIIVELKKQYIKYIT